MTNWFKLLWGNDREIGRVVDSVKQSQRELRRLRNELMDILINIDQKIKDHVKMHPGTLLHDKDNVVGHTHTSLYEMIFVNLAYKNLYDPHLTAIYYAAYLDILKKYNKPAESLENIENEVKEFLKNE